MKICILCTRSFLVGFGVRVCAFVVFVCVLVSLLFGWANSEGVCLPAFVVLIYVKMINMGEMMIRKVIPPPCVCYLSKGFGLFLGMCLSNFIAC